MMMVLIYIKITLLEFIRGLKVVKKILENSFCPVLLHCKSKNSQNNLKMTYLNNKILKFGL